MTKITVGMPTFDDYYGVYESIQALRLYHQDLMEQVEILLVDNNPDSPHGKFCQKLMRSVPNGRYFPYTERVGPWVKDLVVEEASSPAVLCMDSHVMLWPDALRRLIAMYDSFPTVDPRSRGDEPCEHDFFQGPLIYNDLQTISTHFQPVWRGQMWGIWATDDRGRDIDAPPFEIEMQGMGLFSCTKKAWEQAGGFNKLLRGFGGEEGYIHAKFVKAGHKCWCLPFLRWLHRFDRPTGVAYPLNMESKLRNYFICFSELGWSVEPILEHFSKWKPRPMLESILKRVHDELRVYSGQTPNLPVTPAPPVILQPVAGPQSAASSVETLPVIPRSKRLKKWN